MLILHNDYNLELRCQVSGKPGGYNRKTKRWWRKTHFSETSGRKHHRGTVVCICSNSIILQLCTQPHTHIAHTRHCLCLPLLVISTHWISKTLSIGRFTSETLFLWNTSNSPLYMHWNVCHWNCCLFQAHMDICHCMWKEHLNLLICEENHLKFMEDYHKVNQCRALLSVYCT